VNRSGRLLCVVVLIIAVCGCGQRLPLVPVTGVIVSGTTAVEGAQVVFLNDAPGKLPATGMTDAAGRFRLQTYWHAQKKELDGASPGAYRVVVSKVSWPPLGNSTSRDARTLTPPTPTNSLAKRYADAGTSGLSAEVRHGAVNDFTFTLE
jgi:hypothetical protein